LNYPPTAGMVNDVIECSEAPQTSQLSALPPLGPIVIAACDLDKTLFPPAGPEQAEQLNKNIDAMSRFEATGGFVFPVTGNNLLLAQRKFMHPDNETCMLRDLRVNPGIFTNGALVLGPGGQELEKHALGALSLSAPEGEGPDFLTALLDFVDNESHTSLLNDVGICVLTPDGVAGYEAAYSNVEGYARVMNVTARPLPRKDIIELREEILLLLFLFPEVKVVNGMASQEEYDQTTLPWQVRVVEAMEQGGLMQCRYSAKGLEGVGNGIKITMMKDPWPEVDINVAGVDKGQALSRFLQHESILKHLGVDSINPEEQVAVFGDAPNDVPMFRAVDGLQPALRVRMPHSTDKALGELANHSAEVSDVLDLICSHKSSSPQPTDR